MLSFKKSVTCAEVSCWMQTGERQSARMRIAYLRAMLSQDVGFFDTDASTGEIVSRISSDTLLVQDAISEKVHISTYSNNGRYLLLFACFKDYNLGTRCSL
jgi:ABC-type multidrug transport system fused ATPase/permease subunit